MGFVHLHRHSEFSRLDGLGTAEQYAELPPTSVRALWPRPTTAPCPARCTTSRRARSRRSSRSPALRRTSGPIAPRPRRTRTAASGTCACSPRTCGLAQPAAPRLGGLRRGRGRRRLLRPAVRGLGAAGALLRGPHRQLGLHLLVAGAAHPRRRLPGRPASYVRRMQPSSARTSGSRSSRTTSTTSARSTREGPPGPGIRRAR